MNDQQGAEQTGLSTGERLLVGAAELFREKGYAGTTTRELSALVGIQNASLYHHVGGKEDLLYSLCVAALDDVARVFDIPDRGEEPAKVLEQMARGYLEQALKDRDRHATMLTEIRSLSPDRRAAVVARRDENVARLRSVIVSAQEAGQVRADIDPKYLTLALFNLLNWSIFWFNPDGELTKEEIGKILWSVYFDGVAAPAPARTRKPRGTKGSGARNATG
jgi:TetR/AcrR family transcriptional regulator, cholesterol catabolism regulator